RPPMPNRLFLGGTIFLEDRLLADGIVYVEDGHIRAVRPGPARTNQGAVEVIDLHIHGGAGADFMDGTADAFRTVCRAHARHGTTSLLPTTTVGRHEQHLAFFDVRR